MYSKASEHAPLAPSFAPVWGKCSAAVMAAMQVPNRDSEASREGTAVHWVVSSTLEVFRDSNSITCAAYVDQTAPNGVVIDDKMAEGAQIIVDDVLEVLKSGNRSDFFFIEKRVHVPFVHEQNWGTLDAAVYVPERRVLFLWDYKHGHRECQARDNLQLINYALGLRHQLNIDDIQDQQLTVVMRIVQPFCYQASGPVNEWVCKMSDLRGHANQLHAKANEAFSNPQLSSGKHCRDCPAVGKCSGARRATYSLIDVVNEPYEMDNMNGAELATERQIVIDGMAAAKARLEAIEDVLQHRISNGEVTGLALEATFGRLKWTVPPAQANAIANQFGFDISKEEVKTPTQAKQAAPKDKRQMFETVLKTVTKRPPSGFKLTNAEDSKTAKAFKRK